MSRKTNSRTSSTRQPITKADLEKAIAEAVRSANKECEEFVGVVIGYKDTAPSGDANWIVKGIKYGKCNRGACDAALLACVTSKQSEFELTDSV